MSIPTKSDLVSALQNFAHELRSVAKGYSRTEAALASIEEVKAIANIAEQSATSIAATDRSYIHPDTAQTLYGFAEQVTVLAEASTDATYTASLKIPATALRTFILSHMPFMTADGLRFGE